MSSSPAAKQDELRRENDALRNRVEKLERDLKQQVSIKRALQRSRETITLFPYDMASVGQH